MKTQTFSLTHKFVLLAVVIVLVGGVVLVLPHTRANSELSASVVPIQGKGLLLDSSFDGNRTTVESVKLSVDAPQVVSDFSNSKFQNYGKKLFLSPDRRLVAVELNPIGTEVWPSTYIANVDGTQITQAYSGTFSSWAPDSSRVLLYISPMEAPWMRRIYALDMQNKYYDTGLPDGTISADISPVDGSILYSFTNGGTDNSTIYVRDSKGNDKILLQGNNRILTWARWTPKGDKIAFLQSDLLITRGEVWTMDRDGTGAEKVSDVNWGYPAVWSPDGRRIAFANAGDIWEYDIVAKSLSNATNLKQGGAEHPSYSADGKTMAFTLNGQIWKAENGSTTQLTTDSPTKDYSILP